MEQVREVVERRVAHENSRREQEQLIQWFKSVVNDVNQRNRHECPKQAKQQKQQEVDLPGTVDSFFAA